MTAEPRSGFACIRASGPLTAEDEGAIVDFRRYLASMRDRSPSSAVLSHDEVYRYALRRIWDPAKPILHWLMLNPSTADALLNDPTIRRCIAFAKAWGYGGIVVTNLFGLRATNPRELRLAADPVGPWNADHTTLAASQSALTVCAWGANAAVTAEAIEAALNAVRQAQPRTVHCLGRTKSGAPRHPLYVHSSQELEVYAA